MLRPSLLLAGANDAFSVEQLASVRTGNRLRCRSEVVPLVCHLDDFDDLTILRYCDRRPGDRRLLIRDLCILIHPDVIASDSDVVTFGGRWKG